MLFSFPLEFCLCVLDVCCPLWLDLTGGQWGKVRNIVCKQGRTKDKTSAFKVEQNRGFLYITTWHKSFFWGIIIIQNMRLSNNWNGCNRARESFFSFSCLNGHAHTPRGAFWKVICTVHTRAYMRKETLSHPRPRVSSQPFNLTSSVEPSINVSNLRKSVLIGERVGRQNFIGLPNTVICTM